MRGTVAKRIRNEARKIAAKNPTEYKIKWFERLIGKTDSKGLLMKAKVGTVYSVGFRRVYQDMKRQYLRG